MSVNFTIFFQTFICFFAGCIVGFICVKNYKKILHAYFEFVEKHYFIYLILGLAFVYIFL